MAYPLVAVLCAFCRTGRIILCLLQGAAIVNSTTTNRTSDPGHGEKLHASTSHRDWSDRNRHFGYRLDRQRLGAGLSDAAGPLGCRLSPRRRDRYHCAADRTAALGTAGPAIR